MVEIRRIRRDEGMALREVRMRALRESPGVFAANFAVEVRQPDRQWRRRAKLGAAGRDQVVYVADEDGLHGLTAGMLQDSDAGQVAYVFGTWVTPELRRRGIAKKLVDAVIEWAWSRGVDEVRAWVGQTNAATRRLYEDRGFVATSTTQPMPYQPAATALLMVRRR